MGDLLAACIKGKLDSVSNSSPEATCIYRVHDKLRKLNEYAYTPAVVSIGPYHRGKQSLQAMEEYKLRAVNAILARTETPEITLEECIKAMRRLEESARKCYSEHINLSSDEFIEMMLVDGLFIIEFLCGNVLVMNNWMMGNLRKDIMLLENQLPMSVLNTLFHLTMDHNQWSHLTQSALKFFIHLKHKDLKFLEFSTKHHGYEGKHLLDLLGKTLHASFDQRTSTKYELKYLPCVTKLLQAGVKFQKGAGIFFDIKFVDGVLEIPPIEIDENTDSFLRNLIALEQCSYGGDTYIISYATLMDNLINSANDVELLCYNGIIINYLGNDKAVATLFNKLGIDVTIGNFCYSEMCDLNDHYNTRLHVWKATFQRNYFSSPWKILSFFAGILLLILNFIGTLFSFLSFSVHKS